MKENFDLTELGDNDVLSCNDKLFKGGKFRQISQEAKDSAFHPIGNVLSYYGISQKSEAIKEGVNIEFLKVGAKDWQKGRLIIKVIVEICPDAPETNQPESPLDDIRQMINQ